MKIPVLKSLVSYTQNLQNVQFYSYKIKFTVFLKHFRDIMAWASKKPIIKNTIIIYNISVRPKFQLNISKIMPARPKKHWDIGCECHYFNPWPSCGYNYIRPTYFYRYIERLMNSLLIS